MSYRYFEFAEFNQRELAELERERRVPTRLSLDERLGDWVTLDRNHWNSQYLTHVTDFDSDQIFFEIYHAQRIAWCYN